MGPGIFLAMKNLGPRILCVQNFWSQKNFWQEKFGDTKIWVPKSLRFRIIFREKRGTLKLKLIGKFVAQMFTVHCTVEVPVIS